MSLGGPNRPDYLAWERDYPKYFLTRFIGFCLHGFDTWYWYSGIWQMQHTPGATAYGLMLYFGQIDIFGWISYFMRVFVVVLLIFLVKSYIEALCQQWWERKLDHEVPPSRLNALAERWAVDWDPIVAFSFSDGGARARKLLTPPTMVRHGSSVSVKSAPIPRWNEDKDGLEKTRDGLNNWRQTLSDTKSEYGDEIRSNVTTQVNTNISDPEPKIVRTMTDQLRKTLLGWQPEHSFIGGERVYRYTPNLEGLSVAIELLEAINEKHCRPCRVFSWHWDRTFLLFRLIGVMVKRPVRPRALFAVKMHIRSLSYTAKSHELYMMRMALQHPGYGVVSAEDIVLASRILLTLHPNRKPNNWEYFAVAWATFATCSILVIGTELAIQWNYISGVQNISSVGQLIPMAIGVCGLLKTVWTATVDRNHGETWCFGACRGSKKAHDWAGASEAYAKANSAWQRRREPDASKSGAEMKSDVDV
jgi:hypothetical protein